MEVLENPVRTYDWGSYTAIAELQGRTTPSATHEAELWMGAHPGDPSSIGGRSLLEVIRADPDGQLGPVASGARLPFLAKVLAARQALSLQIHPDSGQAKAGFAAEEAAGVPLAAQTRRYKDPYPKPEILVAFTEFEALCGFREISDMLELLLPLHDVVPLLAPTIDALEAGDLQKAVEGLLRHPDPAPLVNAIAAACVERAGDNTAYATVATLAETYPGDVGAVVSLLLRHIRLQPGQGIYQPAGMLHAYIGGVGFEVMGASDNTLRAGLTSKYIDVDEVFHLLRYTNEPATVVDPVTVAQGVSAWKTQAEEFEVLRADVRGEVVALPETASPMVVLCVEGSLTAADGGKPVELPRGTAAWVPSSGGAVTFEGQGVAYVARIPGLA